MGQEGFFTLIEGGGAHRVRARVQADRVLVDAGDLEAVTGWRLKQEGLCKGSACVPLRERGALETGGSVDLQCFADVLDIPFAIDAGAGVAAMEDPPGERVQAQDELVASDFSLPDLGGRLHSLSDFRGKKVLLVAWASW